MRIKVDERKDVEVNGVTISVFRKSKHTYIAQHVLDYSKICSAASLPKVLEKAKGIVKPIKAKDTLAQKTKEQPKKKSIKTLTIEMISKGKEDDDIIKAVKAIEPDSKFDKRHISWYRSTLHRDGIIGPQHAPRRSKAYKKWHDSLAVA